MPRPDHTRRNHRRATDLEPKVKAGGLAGSATIVLVWVAGLAGVDVPPEVASAVTVLISSAVGWWR